MRGKKLSVKRENMKEEILTIRDIILEVLKENEGARNSDTLLIFLFLVKCGQVEIVMGDEAGYFIPKKNYHNLPSMESISRCRRKIQNEEMLYPATDPDVIQRRRQNEEDMNDINKWWDE